MLFLIFKAISNFQVGKHWPLDFDFRPVHAGGAEARSFLFFSTKRKIGKISKSLKRLSYTQGGEERRGLGLEKIGSPRRGEGGGRKEERN